MVYQTIGDFNATGIDGLFLYVANVVPIFMPLLLFGIFIVVFFGTLMNTPGRNFQASFAVAGIITLLATFLLSLIAGLVNPIVLVVVFAVTVIGVIMLLLNKD